MKTGNKIALFYSAITIGVIAVVTLVFYLVSTSYISRLYYSYLTEKAYATAQKHWEKDETDDESYARIQQRYEETLPVATEILLNADSLETRQVLSRYLDGIMIRTYEQKEVEDLAGYGTIPIINGLTDFCHPCQVLADLMTIREKFAVLEGLKLCYIGDGNNMANSLIVGGLKTGMKVSVATPEGYHPHAEVLAFAESNPDFFLTDDPMKAAENADVVITDTWASMGQEEEQKKREEAFKGFCVDSELMSLAAPGVKFLHCLPAHRGEEVTDEVHFADFGRRAILNLRQTLASKILELQKDSLYAKYKDKIGHIIAAEVYQVWKKEILLLDDDGNELLLPKSEQIPTDFYRKGETVRAIVQRVDNYNNNPKILLSRTDKVFLQRLFELEVPEINDGLITIKAIARIPGERAKVAVESYDDRIDPVGACVGMKGSRIHGIVRELRNENIDVINYTSNLSLFIQRALSPAKISSIRVNEEEKKAEVYLRPEEVSLAIGKGGLNIKLACMLTEYTIDVFRDIEGADEEDIYLDEFSDEIDSWVIDALKNIGCYTAKSVLAMNRNEIIERADLEEQTVDDLLAILSAEFEDEGNE